jgi:tRNA 2-thiouridine synthesizing protein A
MSHELPIADTVDASGLNCPLPLLKAKQSLKQLSPGQCLEVIATDPGSVRDFRVFAELSGNALLCSRQEGETYYYVLQKT